MTSREGRGTLFAQRRRWIAAGALLLAACGGPAGPEIGSGTDPGGDTASSSETEVEPARAPECAELEDRGYSPPAEDQPEADPSLTNAQPRRDIEPLEPAEPISEADQWARREAAEHFAGVWFDQTEGATVIAFTEDVDRYAEQVRERFGAGWWVVEAEHSFDELRDVQDRLSQDMQDGWTEDGPEPGTIYGTGIDVIGNRVTVAIMEPDEPRLSELSERYGTEVICFAIERTPTADDAQPAPWEPAQDADLSPESTSIDVLVNEVGCAGGQPADGRIPQPDIVYDHETVVITIGVVPRPGDQTCPGNPDTAYSVELAEPLGGRQLLDGSQDPPTEPDLDVIR
jgi:hypothetical protein